MFNEYRKVKQEKRAVNRDSSAEVLRAKGVDFTTNNEGFADNLTVDFWPGTGKWIVRGGKKAGRGVFNLLKEGGVK